MVVRKVDVGTGDIQTSGIQFVTGSEEIAQTVATRLRLFKGEYIRDIGAGTPWFQEILQGKVPEEKIEKILRRVILQTDGVLAIKKYEHEYGVNDRTYSIKTTLITTFGEVFLKESIRR